jgi:hypothetical protein
MADAISLQKVPNPPLPPDLKSKPDQTAAAKVKKSKKLKTDAELKAKADLKLSTDQIATEKLKAAADKKAKAILKKSPDQKATADLKTLADNKALAEMKAAADLKALTKKDSKKVKVKTDHSKIETKIVKKSHPIFKEDFMRIAAIRHTSFTYAKTDGRSEESVHQARRDFCAATGYNYDFIEGWGEDEANSYYNCEELLDEALEEALRVDSNDSQAISSYVAPSSEFSTSGALNAESRSSAAPTTHCSRGSVVNHHCDRFNSSTDDSSEEEDSFANPQFSTSAEDRVRVISPFPPKKPPNACPGVPTEIKFKPNTTKMTIAAARLSHEKRREAKRTANDIEQMARLKIRESLEFTSRAKVWEENERRRRGEKILEFEKKMRDVFKAASEKQTAL